MTFDRGSGKFPFMKAWINISAVIFAAGMLTALADEPKTNAPAGATSSVPASASPDAVPPTTTATSAPAPAVVHKVKPAAVVPLTPTSAVPARSNITATPLTTTNVNTPPPMPPSTSAPAITDETRTPEEEASTPPKWERQVSASDGQERLVGVAASFENRLTCRDRRA